MLRGSFVAVELLLDGSALIAAGTDEILMGVVSFIFVQGQLRLRKVELLLKIFLGAGAGGGQLLGQIRNMVLVGSDVGLSLFQAGREFDCFGSEGRRIFQGIAKSSFKCIVNRLVRQAQGLLRKIVLLGSDRERSQLLGCLESTSIYGFGRIILMRP